jgi:uncharacterized protein YndB with AHSA1/START domain
MDKNLVAKASIIINASCPKVWAALVNPEAIKQYMFGTTVVTDWREGSDIVWKGVWQGKSYEDKGVILKNKPLNIIQYSHFSPFSGLSDKPENYHIVTIELTDEGDHTRVALTQDKNPTQAVRDHSQKNWEMLLAGLKRFAEQ